jgi:pyrimidine-nucleoside phosphorylase
MPDRTIEELIEIKRDGRRHTREQIGQLVSSYVAHAMPDYQMAAWMMAVLLRGLDHEETVWLTDAMAHSGTVMDLSTIPGVKVDKHSTGGVGDKTTLVLAPMVAACGAPVAKMSGRGLGHTGGTLDKLESIPGFRTGLSSEEFVAQVRRIGVAVIAQSLDIDPADKQMYALRDVTATVPSVPLIVGSIISKKVAGGAHGVVLDVKVGSGAFMKSVEDARVLARELTRTGEALGLRVEVLLTDMDQPLGCAVGNALEVAEAIATLRDDGPEDLFQESLALGSRMLVLAEVARDLDDGRARLVHAVQSGAALEKFRRWVEAQGGRMGQPLRRGVRGALSDGDGRRPRAPRRRRRPGRRAGAARQGRGPRRGRVVAGDAARVEGGTVGRGRGAVPQRAVHERDRRRAAGPRHRAVEAGGAPWPRVTASRSSRGT